MTNFLLPGPSEKVNVLIPLTGVKDPPEYEAPVDDCDTVYVKSL